VLSDISYLRLKGGIGLFIEVFLILNNFPIKPKPPLEGDENQ
jgi:hypothetical protein